MNTEQISEHAKKAAQDLHDRFYSTVEIYAETIQSAITAATADLERQLAEAKEERDEQVREIRALKETKRAMSTHRKTRDVRPIVAVGQYKGQHILQNKLGEYATSCFSDIKSPYCFWFQTEDGAKEALEKHWRET